MHRLLVLMRSWSIRFRMQGAIGVVLLMFALVGVVGVVGGTRIQSLNKAFMEHSVHEIENISTIRAHMARVRMLEKSMVIDYEDGVSVLKHREAWQKEVAAARKAFEAMTEGEDDADNAIPLESIARLDGYTQRSKTVLENEYSSENSTLVASGASAMKRQ